ncbi:hypothetical protein MRB53_014924 [Persea americana]|uniref:Uncharacterized protein n=1 Tax=Persea americana TaxID=3435 RepID=A0ACC2KCE0_PERAE|nr:hypothetical protein MRB53_014924 [Persea americana]
MISPSTTRLRRCRSSSSTSFIQSIYGNHEENENNLDRNRWNIYWRVLVRTTSPMAFTRAIVVFAVKYSIVERPGKIDDAMENIITSAF